MPTPHDLPRPDFVDGPNPSPREDPTAPAAGPLRPGRVIAGRFELSWRIGRGGMGAVFEARQLGVDRRVAVKVIRPEHVGNARVLKRFLREMRATARVEHPNTVRLYDVGREGEDVFIAMELLEGHTLSQEVRERGALPVDRCARIGAQIARGLAAAHRQGIVHRDLKPQNLMITDRYGARDHVKILDFGVARLFGDLPEESITASGAIVGTPEFIAPEVVTPGAFDHRADLYSLGVVLYYLGTGELPFDDAAAVTVMYRHVHEAPNPPSRLRPELPEWFDAVVLRLLAKDPEDRFPDGDVVAEELERMAVFGSVVDGLGDTRTMSLADLPANLLPRPWNPMMLGVFVGLFGGACGLVAAWVAPAP